MENKIDVTVELEQAKAMNQILQDTLKAKDNTIRHFKHVIIALIICFFGTVCVGYGGFIWYESQFEYTADSYEETMTTDGENAYINNVEGSQYNDKATHNEGNK